MENEMDATIQGLKSQALYGSFSKWGPQGHPRTSCHRGITRGLYNYLRNALLREFLGNVLRNPRVRTQGHFG